MHFFTCFSYNTTISTYNFLCVPYEDIASDHLLSSTFLSYNARWYTVDNGVIIDLTTSFMESGYSVWSICRQSSVKTFFKLQVNNHNIAINITFSRQCFNVLLFGITRLRLSREPIKNCLYINQGKAWMFWAIKTIRCRHFNDL